MKNDTRYLLRHYSQCQLNFRSHFPVCYLSAILLVKKHLWSGTFVIGSHYWLSQLSHLSRLLATPTITLPSTHFALSTPTPRDTQRPGPGNIWRSQRLIYRGAPPVPLCGRYFECAHAQHAPRVTSAGCGRDIWRAAMLSTSSRHVTHLQYVSRCRAGRETDVTGASQSTPLYATTVPPSLQCMPFPLISLS